MAGQYLLLLILIILGGWYTRGRPRTNMADVICGWIILAVILALMIKAII